jgi:hypothetical protein
MSAKRVRKAPVKSEAEILNKAIRRLLLAVEQHIANKGGTSP